MTPRSPQQPLRARSPSPSPPPEEEVDYTELFEPLLRGYMAEHFSTPPEFSLEPIPRHFTLSPKLLSELEAHWHNTIDEIFREVSNSDLYCDFCGVTHIDAETHEQLFEIRGFLEGEDVLESEDKIVHVWMSQLEGIVEDMLAKECELMEPQPGTLRNGKLVLSPEEERVREEWMQDLFGPDWRYEEESGDEAEGNNSEHGSSRSSSTLSAGGSMVDIGGFEMDVDMVDGGALSAGAGTNEVDRIEEVSRALDVMEIED